MEGWAGSGPGISEDAKCYRRSGSKGKPDMSPARDGQGAVADVCGSVTVGVLAQVRSSEKAFSVVSPALGSRHLLPGSGVLSDIPAHLLSM